MKDFTKVGIRIFSIYLFIKFINVFGNGISYYASSMNYSGIDLGPVTKISILLTGIYLFFAVAMWIFSEPLAKIIIGESDNVSLTFNINFEELMIVSLKIFGLILIITSLEGAMTEFIKLIGLNLDVFGIKDKLYFLIAFAFPYVKIILGIALISSKRIQKKIIEV